MQHIITCLLCTQDGQTALILASEKGHLEVVTLLLANGADTEAKTNVSLSIFVCTIFNKYRYVYATSYPMLTLCPHRIIL